MYYQYKEYTEEPKKIYACYEVGSMSYSTCSYQFYLMYVADNTNYNSLLKACRTKGSLNRSFSSDIAVRSSSWVLVGLRKVDRNKITKESIFDTMLVTASNFESLTSKHYDNFNEEFLRVKADFRGVAGAALYGII